MPPLGWLLNLDFAGGTAVAPEAPEPHAVVLRGRRIPHPRSQTELRQAWKQISSSTDIITSGTTGQVLIGQGVGVTPTWTKSLTALELLTVDNITIDGATIVSDSGAISFDNENLTTTGTISGVNVTSGADPGHTHSDLGKVKVDASAAANYLGAAYNDGVLRTSGMITYTDGGDYVTIGIGIDKLATANIDAGDSVPFYDILTSTNRRILFSNFEAKLNHDSLFGYVANEHIDHSSVSISSGTGLTGGGAITGNQTLSLSFFNLEDLTEPAGDRILFFDKTAVKFKWLWASTGLDITGTTLTFSHLGIESLSDPGADRILFWDDGETACKWLTVDGTANSAVSSPASALSGTTLTINSGYVKRPSPPEEDYVEGDLTHDSNWYTLGLGPNDDNIIPAGSYAIMLRIRVKDAAVGKSLYIKEGGETYSVMQVNTQEANVWSALSTVVPVNSDYEIGYWSNNAADVGIKVTGWFL